MGSCDVPLIPSVAATFPVYAKYGVVRLRLRLMAKVALLIRRGLKLWLQPALKLSPLVSPVSRKPNNWCESEFESCFWKLKFSRSLLLNGALKRTPMLRLVLGSVITKREFCTMPAEVGVGKYCNSPADGARAAAAAGPAN